MELQNNLHSKYLNYILKGKKSEAERVCLDFIKQGNSVKSMYENIMKSALYEVGELWEKNKVSVATEHMATAISEGILNSVYSMVIPDKYINRKVVLACVDNEDHQVGIKMVADIFEMNKWESFFLGAGIPTSELIKFIDDIKPDLIAISLSVYFNYKNLNNMLIKLNNKYPEKPIIVGGQALNHISKKLNNEWKNVSYIENLNHLEEYIKNFK